MARFDELLTRFFFDPDEAVGPFLERSPAQVPTASDVVAEVAEEFLAFALEGELYAVPIAQVREISKVPPLTEVPRGQRNLLGVMNVRGEMVPVYDLKVRLRLATKSPVVRSGADLQRGARIVLLKDPQGDAAIVVDRVEGVVTLSLSKLESPPQLGLDRSCIAGLGRRGDALIILLDVEQALS